MEEADLEQVTGEGTNRRVTRVLIAAMTIFSIASLCAAADEDLIDADRPGIADGSRTIKRGTLQYEFGVQRQRDDGVGSLFTPALLRYGLSQGFEVRAEGNGWQRANGVTQWTPASLGFKFHLLDAPSLGVIARAFQHGTTDVRLCADIDANEKWSINPNIGVVSQRDNGSRFTAALAALTLQYNISSKANVFIDGGYESHDTTLLLDAGGAWILGRNTQLDVSAGWGAQGSTSFFASAGVSHRF